MSQADSNLPNKGQQARLGSRRPAKYLRHLHLLVTMTPGDLVGYKRVPSEGQHSTNSRSRRTLDVERRITTLPGGPYCYTMPAGENTRRFSNE